MASSAYTPNLGLCDWSATDRPKRADFVSDNNIIDTALGGHLTDTGLHLTAEQKEKALEPCKTYIYAGSGTATRDLTTSFRPSFAIVFKRDAPMNEYVNGVNMINSAYASYGHSGTSGMTVNSNGVTVVQDSEASNGKKICLNETGSNYVLIVFR